MPAFAGMGGIEIRKAVPFMVAIVVAFLSSAAPAQVVDRTTIINKVMCGYQGWFSCPGDGNAPGVGWNHWSKAWDTMGPGLYNTDIWPDVAEYDPSDLYAVPNTVLTNGGAPYLFSACRQGAVNVHFRWMQENGIDGVYHQRFVGGYVGNPNDIWQRKLDTVLQNVMNAANSYGRAWALEYDISGVNTSDVYSKLTGDWSYLRDTFNIKNHPRYLHHNGKPVVIVWGFGFSDRPGTPAIAQNVIDWFKNDGCFVMLGVPRGWRTDSTWISAYQNADGITPWTVGSYTNRTGINNYKPTVQSDLSYCNSRGMIFMPTAWPRFGWDNMFGYSCGTSKISPRLGQHFWDQVHMYKSVNVPCQFIAMFDEYDESTAIMKLTDNVPTTGCWWTTEGKGSDWYLRLANQASRMQRGEIAISQTIPITSSNSPDNAQIISHTIPSSMFMGDQYSVSVTVKNTGETTWCDPNWWRLAAVGDSDPFAATRQPLPTGTAVMPNQQYTFNFTMTAPSVAGTYTTDWRMVHELIRWFGDTLSLPVVVGPDTAPPGAVTGLSAPSGDGQVILLWHNPSDADFAGTMIRCKTSGYPTSATDGTLVCNRSASPGSNDGYVHTGMTNGTTYYYAAYAYDEVPNYSPAATAIARPDVSPGPVTGFTATPGDTHNSLFWHNPSGGGFTGTMVRYRTDAYPASASDGTLVCDKANAPNSNDTFVHAGLANGTPCYYAAFAYNSAPNYSSAATAVAAPQGGACLVDGFAYPNGSLNGNGGWSGSATTQIAVENETIKIVGGSGAYDAVHSVACANGPVAVRFKAKKSTGILTIWNLYIIGSSGGDLGRWYGTATSGRGRVGSGTPTSGGSLTGGWDELYAKVDFAAGSTQFVMNGVTLGTLSHTGGSAIGSVRIERPSNQSASGQYIDLDDIVVGPADVTPASAIVGAPSAQVARTGPVSFPVSFDESVFGFNAASDVQVNATGSAAAGTVTVAGSGSGAYTVTLSNVSGSGALGITVKAASCTDVAGNANLASSASATFEVLASDGRISDARSQPDGTPVGLGGKALYLMRAGFGYIEEMDRTAGIRVEGALGGSVGDLVCLSGVTATTPGGERYVLVDAMGACGTGAVDALGLNNRAAMDGIVCGLHVKVWGRVKPGSITGNSFVLSDGSDSAGIRVITPGAPNVSDNEYVEVTGAAGVDSVRVVYQ